MKFYVKAKLSDNMSETPEGFLVCRNVMLTHTGILRYGPDEHPFGDEVGEVVMRRTPEELFSLATMASFEAKDITIEHPEDFVDPDNYQDLTHGVMFNIRRGKEPIDVEGEIVYPLLGDFLIKSSEAIELVKEGLREVSLGYEAFWELINDSEGKHTKIVGNHCALVDQGRAGKYCGIKDHKKETEEMSMTTLNKKFKKLFGKSADEMMKEKEDEIKAKDEAEKKEKEGKDESEEQQAKEDEKMMAMEVRLTKLEEMLGKLLSKLDGEETEDEEELEEIVADEDEDEESDESEDEGHEAEDEGYEEEQHNYKVGDSANNLSYAEILAPGIKQSKNIKMDALKTAYKTKDGKAVIDTLTGGKDLSKFKGVALDAVFKASAEMMKARRTKDFAAQRVVTIDAFPSLKGSGKMTAEEINKKNAEFYSNKK